MAGLTLRRAATSPYALDQGQGNVFAPPGMPAMDDTTPYDPTIDALRKRILELQQGAQATYTPEQIDERRSRNDREYNVGLAMSLSQNPALQHAGGNVFKHALEQSTPKVTERGTMDPITGEWTYNPEYRAQTLQTQLDAMETRRSSALEARRKEYADRQFRLDAEARHEQLLRGLKQMGIDANAGKGDAANEMRRFRGEDALRGDFERLTKDLREQVQQTGTISELIHSAPQGQLSPVAQQSIVILLNKFQDPGSVVREGEFKRVVDAQGLVQRAQNLSALILQGAPLSPEMVEQIDELSKLYAKAASSKIQRYGKQYADIATRRGYNVDSVISDPAWRGVP